MSEEEKEAIERCNELIKVEHANWIGMSNQQAIETVLQALENSIPKEIVENKVKQLENIARKADILPITVKEERIDGTTVYSQRFNADGYIAQAIIKVLQDLLEGK